MEYRTGYRQAFTVVELLVVIVVIAILAAVGFAAYNGVIDRSREAAAGSHLGDLIKKIEIKNITDGQYPVDLSGIEGAKSGDLLIPYDTRYCVVTSQGGQTYSRFNGAGETQKGYCHETAPSYALATESCFNYNSATQAIDGYYMHQADLPQNPLCPSDFTIPSSINGQPVEHIAAEAFRYNTTIKKVALADGIKTIEPMSFADSALEYIYLPSSLERIEYAPFLNTNLTSLVVPPSVSFIQCMGFSGLPSLRSLVIGVSATDTDPEISFNCPLLNGYSNSPTSLQSVTLGPRISAITSGAFYGEINLKNVTILDGSTALRIESGGLSRIGATSLTLPGRTSYIGSGGLTNTSSLVEFTVKEGSNDLVVVNGSLSGIPLEKINLPSNTTLIEGEAFNYLSSLKTLTIATNGSRPLTLKGSAFGGSSLQSVTIPSQTTRIAGAAFQDSSSLTTLTIDSSGSVPLSIDEGSFRNSPLLTSVAFPARVHEIANSAFYGCSSLSTVTFERGIETIGDYAFANTAITSVSLPSETAVSPTAFPVGTTITRF